MCLRGVSEVDKKLLEGNDDDLSVLVVWSSQLGAKEKHVAEAAALMQDPRVRHYWDGDRLAGKVFQPHLDLDSPAWDVWLLFPPGARWDAGEAPEPAWWEHQLQGMPSERRLDPKRFAAKARELMRAPGSRRAAD